jgi:hypothetical protein
MTARWLSILVRVSTARPWLTVGVALVLAAVALAYTARGLTFQTSNLRLLPATAPYAVRYAQYLEDFGELNDIVVVVQAPSPDEGKRYVTRLVAELGHGPVDEGRLPQPPTGPGGDGSVHATSGAPAPARAGRPSAQRTTGGARSRRARRARCAPA